MTKAFRALLLAGVAAVGLGSATPAGAVPHIIVDTTSQPGTYTVVNDTDLYINEFWITHEPMPELGLANAFRTNWTVDDFIPGPEDEGGCGSSCDDVLIAGLPTFHFRNQSPILSGETLLSFAIGPHSSSDPGDFDFGPPSAVDVSIFRIFLVDAAAPSIVVETIDASTLSVPLPATLPLMATVLGAGCLLASRRRRRSRPAAASSGA